MKDNAIDTPDPDQEALQDTNSARFHKVDGKVIIGYCVDIRGATTDIHVVQPFPKDPQIGAIISETIEKWRYKPFIVDGKPVKTCTERTFNLVFK